MGGCFENRREQVTVREDEFSGRVYKKYGMSWVYKDGYTGWLNHCNFICSIHGDFTAQPKSLVEGKTSCRKCKSKTLSKNTTFRKTSKIYGVGVFDLDLNLFEDVSRYVKIKNLWIDMLERCYTGRDVFKSYADCVVGSEWHRCSNFFEDVRAMDNYEKIHEGWHLDKDIIVKGNRRYSRETCCIVPLVINCIFTKSGAIRGLYPIGVTYSKDKSKFLSACYENGSRKFLGYFNTPEEAFHAYKGFKESLIKKKAEEFRHCIGNRVSDAMLKYNVEITD